MNKEINWKEELKLISEKGCTDSDIMDYIEEHPNINEREIWDYIYELSAPEHCKGCEFIQMNNMYPCNVCIRRNELKDYYKRRQG